LAVNAGFLVDPEDVDSIADGMRQSVVDVELRTKLVDVGLEHVKEFSWKKCAEQTIKVLINF